MDTQNSGAENTRDRRKREREEDRKKRREERESRQEVRSYMRQGMEREAATRKASMTQGGGGRSLRERLDAWNQRQNNRYGFQDENTKLALTEQNERDYIRDLPFGQRAGLQLARIVPAAAGTLAGPVGTLVGAKAGNILRNELLDAYQRRDKIAMTEARGMGNLAAKPSVGGASPASTGPSRRSRPATTPSMSPEAMQQVYLQWLLLQQLAAKAAQTEGGSSYAEDEKR